MNRRDFVEEVVRKGIEAAKRDYNRPDQNLRLRGSIAGFEACRGKYQSMDLYELLRTSKRRLYLHRGKEDYKYHSSFRAEVEWVCNCFSAVMLLDGFPMIMHPTAKAMQTAVEIIKGQQN